MSSSQLLQKPALWYTVEPLWGSGKNGAFRDEDFISALYISMEKYHTIKRTCIEVLDRQAVDPASKIDLRRLWKGRDGQQTKAMMLEDVIRVHPEVFSDTGRLQHIPDNWNTVRQTLVELLLLSANAIRSRRLPRKNTRSRTSSASRTPSPTTTEHQLPSECATIPLPPYSLYFLLTHDIILDNIFVPVVFGSRRVDILPRRFQKSDSTPGNRQRLGDVSLDRLLSTLAREFETQNSLQVWGKSSFGSFTRLETDDQLIVALIFYLFLLLQSPGQPDHLQSPGLEVRQKP